MAADEELEKEKSRFGQFVQDQRKKLAEHTKDIIDAGIGYGKELRKQEKAAEAKRKRDAKKNFEKESGRKVVKSKSTGNWTFAGADGKATTDMVGEDDIKKIEGQREEESRWDKLIRISEANLKSNEKQSDFLSEMLEKAKDKVGGVLALLAAPIVAVIAFFAEIAKQIKGIGLGGKMVKPFITFFKGLIKFSAKTLILPLKVLDAVLGKFTKGKLKPFKLFLDGVNKIFTRIGTIAKFIGTNVDDLVKFFQGAGGKLLTKFPKTVAAITSFFKGLADIAKTIFNMGKTLATATKTGKMVLSFAAKFGSILGKLFLPFTIIMGIWDTVKGAIEGFNTTEGGLTEKIIGAITGGIGGLVNSIVGIPLDLLKSGVAWLLKKMGFDESAEALQSFSFVDIFNKIFGSIKEVINGIIKTFKNAFGKFEEGDWLGGLNDIKNAILDILLAPIYMIMKTLDKIFDIDIRGMLSKIPGFDKVANFIFGKDETPEQAANDAAREEAARKRKETVAFNQEERSLKRKLNSARMDVEDSGAFSATAFLEDKKEKEEDRKKLESLQLQLAELRAEREMQLSVGSQVGGGVVVNNDNRDQSQGKGALNNSGNIADRHGTKSGGSRR